MDQQQAGSTIPTLPDLMEHIERRFLDGVAIGKMHDDIADSLSTAVVEGTNGDVFSFLALGRGCHAAAEACRKQGDQSGAEFFQSIGQLLLWHAADALARLAALDVHLSGVTRH